MIHNGEHPSGDDFESVYGSVPDPSPVAKQTVINAVRAEIREKFGKTSEALPARNVEKKFSWGIYLGLSVCAALLVAVVMIYGRPKQQKLSQEYSSRDEHADSVFNSTFAGKNPPLESGEVGSSTHTPDVISSSDYVGNQSGKKAGGVTRDTNAGSGVVSDFARTPSENPRDNMGDASKHGPPSLGVTRSDSSASPAPLYASLLNDLDSSSTTRLTTILEKTRTAGLPVEPLEARIAEGIKRDVPVERIIVVARNYSNALLSAKSAIGPRSSSELQLGAEAILAGVPINGLKSINNARPNGSLVRPLLALTDLIASGIRPVGASSAIMALLEKNNNDVRIQAFQAEVAGRIKNGALPDAALTTSLQKYGLRGLDARQDIKRIDSMPRTDKVPRGN